ncbi:hypothetical protein AB205_0100760 [Aquarana catesbeiana]|uniref:Uncharacterized protein n=1 Tax=Aquarana catesbeiana TaxID=8400 RepID=A0A2G9RFE1_AQUCT|nr:hypothetical protein AB205_0100760 [Aquarana catesbeiana]
MPPAESLLTSGALSGVSPYIRCPPTESLLTSGAPSRVSLYIRCP